VRDRWETSGRFEAYVKPIFEKLSIDQSHGDPA